MLSVECFQFLHESLFITFEGTEGCGKSTQVALLAEGCKGLAITMCLRYANRGGTSIGDEIRYTLNTASKTMR